MVYLEDSKYPLIRKYSLTKMFISVVMQQEHERSLLHGDNFSFILQPRDVCVPNVKARDEHQSCLLIHNRRPHSSTGFQSSGESLPLSHHVSLTKNKNTAHMEIKPLNKCSFWCKMQEDRPRRALLQKPCTACNINNFELQKMEGSERKWHLGEFLTLPSSLGLCDGFVY